MHYNEIYDKVWSCLKNIVNDTNELKEDTHLFDAAVLDSIDTLEFLENLESVCNINIEDEVIFDDNDNLKSISRGYASFYYEIKNYKDGNLVKVGVLINAESVDSLSFIVHRERADFRARAICEKLKELIPRQLLK